ncbi:hypothetical protein J2Q02_12025 [Tenacibaculum finnmarkense genomovar finnmarkense]|uniref:hypothetical protein n=1 Tax=Tenacibaculum finnmarkense TaxID=2781243 RepID=UPI001EFB4098|nr:hypothetical protein [Tenacibaculum finnmarkense]MCG8220939.1 hypothetical protein [Tenacibaculum finnmarkense genomovar finnmarkense]MCG8223668.1 hypothetical protein [Tenacibaculum finnmarkense genomovar finnmarkense]MCG8229133.1 hypothetical protein [Tenacibaculum finnmarkense genomovar finnmarkense]
MAQAKNRTMNKLTKKLSIIFLPSLLWVGLTALGFGAQSLSNTIELFTIFILSLICSLIPERIITLKSLMILLFVIVFLARFLTPNIPE